MGGGIVPEGALPRGPRRQVNPDAHELMLQQGLTTSAGIFMRIQLRLQGWVFRLLKLPFLQPTQAREEAQQFFDASQCCLPAGFSRRIRAMRGVDGSVPAGMGAFRGADGSVPVGFDFRGLPDRGRARGIVLPAWVRFRGADGSVPVKFGFRGMPDRGRARGIVLPAWARWPGADGAVPVGFGFQGMPDRGRASGIALSAWVHSRGVDGSVPVGFGFRGMPDRGRACGLVLPAWVRFRGAGGSVPVGFGFRGEACRTVAVLRAGGIWFPRDAGPRPCPWDCASGMGAFPGADGSVPAGPWPCPWDCASGMGA